MSAALQAAKYALSTPSSWVASTIVLLLFSRPLRGGAQLPTARDLTAPQSRRGIHLGVVGAPPVRPSVSTERTCRTAKPVRREGTATALRSPTSLRGVPPVSTLRLWRPVRERSCWIPMYSSQPGSTRAVTRHDWSTPCAMGGCAWSGTLPLGPRSSTSCGRSHGCHPLASRTLYACSTVGFWASQPNVLPYCRPKRVQVRGE